MFIEASTRQHQQQQDEDGIGTIVRFFGGEGRNGNSETKSAKGKDYLLIKCGKSAGSDSKCHRGSLTPLHSRISILPKYLIQIQITF